VAVHLGPSMISVQLMIGVPFGAFGHDDSEASWSAWRQEPRIIAARRRGGSALTGRHGWESPTSKQQEPNSAGP
jgi:hypothetical protein